MQTEEQKKLIEQYCNGDITGKEFTDAIDISTEARNESNAVLVSIADMLQYSETQWVISCNNCGAEHWFELPQDGDKCECDCGSVLVVCGDN